MKDIALSASDVDLAARLALAALIGLSVGFERQRSGHASGPQARFAGIRTFLLLGVLGGCAGLMIVFAQSLIAAVLLLGGVALSVGAYVMAVRRPRSELDGTTEAAAIMVLGLGALAGVGQLGLAAGATAIIVLALSEKMRLHWLVQRVEGEDFRAGLQFAVLALVVLPLLPEGPIWGVLAVRPRTLWTIVLLFSGLNFFGYLARRAAGTARGFAIAGMLGGLISSTAIALDFSRRSRSEPAFGVALAHGVIGACVVLLPRVLIVSAVLNAAVSLALLPLLAPALLLGACFLAFILTRHAPHSPAAALPTNPLQLWSAIRMAVVFQAAVTILALVRTKVDTSGLYATGAVLGLTDVDALTVAMSRTGAELTANVAARAVAVGIVANTMLKLGICVVVGQARFRLRATIGLAGLAIASVAGLVFF